MNPFMYPQLPFAMQNMPSQQAPRSGVNAMLPANPQVQALLQQMGQNPLMTTAGQSVPQQSWAGNTFNMAPRGAIPTGITTPGAPTAPATPAAMTGPNAPVWTQGQFVSQPYQPGQSSYAQPSGPVPPGYEWNVNHGFWQTARPDRGD